MREIQLTHGKVALVDDEDYAELSRFKWRAQSSGRSFYAARTTTGRRKVYMHAVIVGTPRGAHTDHIDGDGLNNQRSNLRETTCAQNQLNRVRKKAASSSRFRGVHREAHSGKWRACLVVDGKNRWLGRFACEFAAAGAYDAAGIARDPEHFRPNFSASWLAPVRRQ